MVHRSQIPVISIKVNPNEMMYTPPEESQTKLLAELELWMNMKGLCHTVWRWQHMAGWMNWCFNIYPLLRPALCNVYDKLHNKTNPAGSIWINNAVRTFIGHWRRSNIHQATTSLTPSLGQQATCHSPSTVMLVLQACDSGTHPPTSPSILQPHLIT